MQHKQLSAPKKKSEFHIRNNDMKSWNALCLYPVIPATWIEPTMNTLVKNIFNALAFANANNLGEFQTLLRQIDAPESPVQETPSAKASAKELESAAVLGHIQGAV